MTSAASIHRCASPEKPGYGFRIPLILQLLIAGACLLAVLLLAPIGTVALAWYNGD